MITYPHAGYVHMHLSFYYCLSNTKIKGKEKLIEKFSGFGSPTRQLWHSSYFISHLIYPQSFNLVQNETS